MSKDDYRLVWRPPTPPLGTRSTSQFSQQTSSSSYSLEVPTRRPISVFSEQKSSAPPRTRSSSPVQLSSRAVTPTSPPRTRSSSPVPLLRSCTPPPEPKKETLDWGSYYNSWPDDDERNYVVCVESGEHSARVELPTGGIQGSPTMLGDRLIAYHSDGRVKSIGSTEVRYCYDYLANSYYVTSVGDASVVTELEVDEHEQYSRNVVDILNSAGSSAIEDGASLNGGGSYCCIL